MEGNGRDDFLLEIIHSKDDNPANTLLACCSNLLSKNELVDCTVICMDGQVQAHKLVLAAISKSMCDLFTSTPLPTPCTHPMIFLKKFCVEDVQFVLEYMYTGTTSIPRNKLGNVLKICNELDYKSLTTAIIRARSKTISPRISAPHTRQLVNGNSETSFSSAPKPSSTNGRPPSSRNSPNEDHAANSNTNYMPLLSSSNQVSYESEEKAQDVQLSHATGPGQHDSSNSNCNESQSSSTSKPNSPSCHNVKNEIMSGDEEASGEYLYDDDTPSTQPLLYPSTSTSSNGINPPHSTSTSLDQVNSTQHDTTTNGNGTKRKRDSEDSQDGNVEKMRILSNNVPSRPCGNNSNDQNENLMYSNAYFQQEDENESGDDENEDESDLIGVNPEDLLEISQNFKLEQNGESQSQCPWCNESFINMALLQKHLRTHVNKYRPYSCEFCGNSFARSAHLKRHLRVHTGEKPYVCNICARPFARQDKLKGHMERHVQHTNRVESLNATSDAITITSYPQPNGGHSQSAVEQVSVKTLLPSRGPGRPPKISNNANGLSSTSFNPQLTYDPLLLRNNASDPFMIGNNFRNNSRFEIGSTTSNGLSISFASSSHAPDTREKTNAGGITVTPATRPSSSYIQNITVRGAGTMFTGDKNSSIKRGLKPKPFNNFIVNHNNN